VHVDDFKPKADDPLNKPGEGSLIGQLGAEGGRLRACPDLAVVELRAQRSAGLAAESDLICAWLHWNYASQSVVYGAVSVPGGGACVVTWYRVILGLTMSLRPSAGQTVDTVVLSCHLA
jgi:hypothetical protein